MDQIHGSDPWPPGRDHSTVAKFRDFGTRTLDSKAPLCPSPPPFEDLQKGSKKDAYLSLLFVEVPPAVPALPTRAAAYNFWVNS